MIDLSNYDNTFLYVQKLTSFLSDELIHFIYDLSLVDCLMNNDFQKLPCNIRNELSQLTLSDLYTILKTESLESCCELANSIQKKVKELSLFSHILYQESKDQQPAKELRGMKQKKSHEVQQICPLIHSIWKEAEVNTVVDIGAGQGFISYYLADHYKYNVIGVETQKQLVDKINAKYAIPNFRMIEYNITQEMHSKELEGLTIADNYGIIGLHCCGDLSSSMCRLFVEEESHAKLLLFVGCCYNLLSTPETSSTFGYPMNPDIVKIPLTKRARNGIVQNTQFDSLEQFKSIITKLFYRCLLQLWIHLYYPEEDDAIAFPVGKLPFQYPTTTFKDYLRSFYNTKHPQDSVPSDEEIDIFFKTYEQYFCIFASSYVLMNLYPFNIQHRILYFTLGQLLESLIIADRILFLQKHSIQTDLCCVFDRKKSPRCMCLIAKK